MMTAWPVKKAAGSVSCVGHSFLTFHQNEPCIFFQHVPNHAAYSHSKILKEELSFFVCFQQITPGIACPALRAFTSKAVCPYSAKFEPF